MAELSPMMKQYFKIKEENKELQRIENGDKKYIIK